MQEEIKRYRCKICGWTPADNEPDGDREHCPNCLGGVHEEEDSEGV